MPDKLYVVDEREWFDGTWKKKGTVPEEVEKFDVNQPRHAAGEKDASGRGIGGRWKDTGAAKFVGGRFDDLADAIDSGIERIRVGDLVRNNNTTYVVEYDGTAYFIKEVDFGKHSPEDLRTEMEAELVSYEVAKVMGMERYILPVWDVSSADMPRVATPYVQGTPWVDLSSNTRWDVVSDMSDEVLTRLVMFDLVTGQRDRHSGNIMHARVDGQDEIALIDNGMSFVFRGGHPHIPSKGYRPAQPITRAASTKRVLSRSVIQEFVSKRDEMAAVIPDSMDPDSFHKRLDLAARLLLDQRVTVAEFEDMVRAGQFD